MEYVTRPQPAASPDPQRSGEKMCYNTGGPAENSRGLCICLRSDTLNQWRIWWAMTKKQHYMTWEERQQLEAMRRNKIPVAEIAKQLGFCRQTIYNELNRGRYVHTCSYWDEERYSAEKAQAIHDYNQTAKGRPLKIGNDRALANFLEAKMLGKQADGKIDKRKRYSPAAALALARRAGYPNLVCVVTLYSYIAKGVFLHLTNRDLWEKGKPKKQGYKPVRRIAHPALPSISGRPEAIGKREELGHQEIDLVVGAAKTKGAVLTITDRKGRTGMSFKLPDKRAESVRAVFDRLERKLGKRRFQEMFRSITTDNGPEFLEYDKLTESIFGGKRFEVYYCHSYSAWEKGTCENYNRLLRRFFPKGTDFSKISQREIQEAADFLNHYPRKILDWKCPAEIGM